MADDEIDLREWLTTLGRTPIWRGCTAKRRSAVT